jgi:signal transduction histidine kinase
MPLRRYKQTILFVLILVVPCVAIALLGWRDFNRDRDKRVKDAEDRQTSEVRSNLLQTLQQVKLQEISGAPSKHAVALVAVVDDNTLRLPWDVEADHWREAADRFRESLEDPSFIQKILRARRVERSEKNYDAAAALYRELISATAPDSQRVYAQFLLAGSLDRSGRKVEAFRIHRELLKLPASAVDEYGIPIAYFVALRMTGDRRASEDLLDRVAAELRSPSSIPSSSLQMLREVLEKIKDPADPGLHRAVQLLNELSAQERYRNNAAVLQRDFASLQLTPAVWKSYRTENGVWLVGITSSGTASPAKAIAIDAAAIFKTIESQNASRHAGASFSLDTDGAGQPLSDDLPGVRIRFAPQQAAGLWAVITDEQPVHVLTLASVMALTVFGGFLLWRDTRRETRLAELRTQFVASVSHELKTPLTAIRMFAEIMQMQGPGNPQLHADHLDTIVNETERLTRLLNNVLDFSRIERGEKNYNAQPSSLLEVVKAAARTMRYPLAERGFNFKLNIEGEIPTVSVDRDAIEQAILNLLSNAMKYSGQSRDIELRLFTENGSAIIQVADHGIGIPVEEQQRIFDRFYRVPTQENRAIAGTGLGLALVAHIAKAHRGHVEVESSPGCGSTFSIWLPLDVESYS